MVNKNSKLLNNSQDLERINVLRELISLYQKEYHELDSPSVSDEVYDSLVRELKSLEGLYPEFKKGTPLERIGGKPLESFSKVNHGSRVTSLNDVFSFEEIKDWQERIYKVINKKIDYFCELKLDGLSAILIYENGVFVKGATRGDGLVGEDITENLKMIESVPLKLSGKYPKYVEIRGEIIMLKKVFEDLNKWQEKNNKSLFANTRNAAAGSIRQLDPNLVKGRKPNLYISLTVVKVTGQKAAYTRNKGFNKRYYHDLIMKAITEHRSLGRSDIDELIWEKLPDIYDDKQKKVKINNLISELRRLNKIRNEGSDHSPIWVLISD